jgi:hypothetical protein
VIYEKWDGSSAKRWLLAGVSVVLAAGYLWIIWGASEIGMEIVVRTAALLSAIIVGIIWVPSIKGRVSFNETFLGAFKAFFIALFFSGVIFAGVAIIISAVDLLLFQVDSNAYAHTANIVFTLFAPIYFLSLIPNYQKADQAVIDRIISCPRFLEILISNILIPLVSVFTVILVIYIGLNIRGEFWTENLIEPMLVSYSIVVIVLMLLSANLTNRFATLFRKVFPKVLIPLVVLQLVASVLKIGESGLTHSRYYVIMYGVFAAVAGVVFSFLKPTKTGIIAVVLIAFSLLSTIPPVDAFGVSKRNQIATLQEVLEKNGMFVDGKIVPKSDVPEDDKELITNTAEYIWRMEYADEVPWLGRGFDYYGNFEQTFGFSWNEYPGEQKFYKIFRRIRTSGLDISGYDAMARLSYYSVEPDANLKEKTALTYGADTYRLGWDVGRDAHNLFLEDQGGTRLVVFDYNTIRTQLDGLDMEDGMERGLTNEEATFQVENERVVMTIIVDHYEMYPASREQEDYNIQSDFYVLIDWKE